MRVMAGPGFAGAMALAAAAAFAGGCTSGPPLHPSVRDLDAIVTRQVHAGAARQAVRAAVAQLKSKGVSAILVCRVTAIEAPLGGFVIDATGRLVQGSREYALFRIGIRDGSDGPRYPAGSSFVFLAKGADEQGRTVWIPAPGPDADPNQAGFVAEYEFLYDRAEFEQVPTSCRR